MIHGESHPDRAHDRGGDGRGLGGPAAGAGLIEELDRSYPGGEWLRPAWSAVGRGFQLVDKARLVLTMAVGGIVLMYVGAKIEREMQRRQLRVLDGAAEGGEVDLTEGTGGDRG